MRRIFFLYLVCLFPFAYGENAYSQNEQLIMSHYIDAVQYYNPSNAGFDKMYRVSAFHNIDKIKNDSLSNSTLFLLNIPLKLGTQYFGIGGEINMRNVGKWKNTEFCVSYSWVKEISKVKMSVGGGVIFRKQGIDASQNIENQDYAKGSMPYGSAKGFDLSLGITVSAYNAYLSISSRNVLGTRIVFGDLYIPMQRNYNLIGAYTIDIPSYKLDLTPSFIFSTDDSLKYRAELNFSSWYNKMLYLSLGYRIKDSFMAGVGMMFKNFTLGYMIHFPDHKHKMNESGWCTQEFFVSYRTNMFFDRKKGDIRKSIRLL